VLMRKERSYAEVYNDKWDTVVNVFQVLRNPELAEKLEKLLRLTPFSRSEFNKIGEIDLAQITDAVEKARLTIFRSFAGFGSASTNAKYATGFRANSHRSGTAPAHDWKNFPDNIKSFVQRLSGVVIESKDYKQLLAQHDSNNTLFFADPPYVHHTRNMKRGNAAYEYEMTDADHEGLCKDLRSVSGGVLLCGYENQLYNDLLPDWEKVSRDAFADGARKRTEVLWINPKASIDRLLK
jgi:DNA adenine methylase